LAAHADNARRRVADHPLGACRLRQASDPEIGGGSIVPTRAFSTPLFVAAAGWVIAGFGALIKEDYWEMRLILGIKQK